MAYSSDSDLLIGNIPLPGYISPTKIVDDAADEIDSQLGFIYVTPISAYEGGPLTRPARLLLKRINNNLASGRLILQLASSDENRQVHAYGWQLIEEATAALKCIREGEVVLEGAERLPNAVTEAVTVPLIANVDSESSVEAFYDRIGNPNYHYPPVTGIYNNPDKLVG